MNLRGAERPSHLLFPFSKSYPTSTPSLFSEKPTAAASQSTPPRQRASAPQGGRHTAPPEQADTLPGPAPGSRAERRPDTGDRGGRPRRPCSPARHSRDHRHWPYGGAEGRADAAQKDEEGQLHLSLVRRTLRFTVPVGRRRGQPGAALKEPGLPARPPVGGERAAASPPAAPLGAARSPQGGPRPAARGRAPPSGRPRAPLRATPAPPRAPLRAVPARPRAPLRAAPSRPAGAALTWARSFRHFRAARSQPSRRQPRQALARGALPARRHPALRHPICSRRRPRTAHSPAALKDAAGRRRRAARSRRAARPPWRSRRR